MSSRERILARLRRSAAVPSALPPVPADADLFLDHPLATSRPLADLFGERLIALRGEFVRVPDLAGAARAVEGLVAGAASIAVEDDPFVASVLGLAPALSDRVGPAGRVGTPREFARHEAGISTARFLVARTGSLVLRSAAGGGRLLSVLPPLHVVVAPASALVPSLEDVLPPLAEDRSWSYAVLATGPSRTADIEKILVLGAHGPRRLAVVLVGDRAGVFRP